MTEENLGLPTSPDLPCKRQEEFAAADTALVTGISQDLSGFALHAPSASAALLLEGNSDAPRFAIDPAPLQAPDTGLRLFGKPEIRGRRRMGVALARGESVEQAREKARAIAAGVRLA